MTPFPGITDYRLIGLAFSSAPSPFLFGTTEIPLNVDGFGFEESFDCTEFYYNIGPGSINDTDRRFEGVSSFSILSSVDILSPSIVFLLFSKKNVINPYIRQRIQKENNNPNTN